MPKTELTIALGDHAQTRAVRDGHVGLPDHKLVFKDVAPISKAFRQMVRNAAFDVSEMAATTYLLARAQGVPITALPIFLTRGLHHGAMVRRPDIAGPKALEGKAVAVNRGYTVTTSVWARAILALEHGVDLAAMTWVPTAEEHVPNWSLPRNVAAPRVGVDVATLLARGDVVAATGLKDVPATVPLIDDPIEAGLAALQRGFYPINHLLVVRDAVLDAAPDLPHQLFAAFAEAKRRSSMACATTNMPSRAEGLLDDPLPYGLAPNLEMFDLLIGQCVVQGILEGHIRAEDLFPASVSDLVG